MIRYILRMLTFAAAFYVTVVIIAIIVILVAKVMGVLG